MGKLYFLLAERISSSSIGSFGSSGYSFSSHLYMLDLFHPQSCTLFACIHSGEWFCLLSYKNMVMVRASMDLVGSESHCNQLAAC